MAMRIGQSLLVARQRAARSSLSVQPVTVLRMEHDGFRGAPDHRNAASVAGALVSRNLWSPRAL